MKTENDYTPKVLVTLAILAAVMLCMVFIPSHTFGSVNIRRANIISDIVSFNDESLSNDRMKDKLMKGLDTTFLSDIPEEFRNEPEDESPAEDDSVENIDYTALPYIPIEDFSKDSMMLKFYRAVSQESSSRLVRIGICGDSFIEADILTSDLRDMLQDKFGGEGIGFVPFSHSLLKYRSTVSSSTLGWTDYSIMKKKSIPQEYLSKMYISGSLSVPAEKSARSLFRGNSTKKHSRHSSQAELFFRNTGNTSMEITVNDSISEKYTLEKSPEIQKITIKKPIDSFCVDLSNVDGFTGYGLCFDGEKGIAVDNYSIRGNSGLCLFHTDRVSNCQMNSFLKYDLIILQYGLNVASEDNTNYTFYGTQLRKIIGYFRECFPQSAIMIMSISDRGSRSTGSIQTMKAIPAMVAEQRRVAKETGVAFWNTFQAMGGMNSIAQYVAKGWAGKDYTHINAKGGKQLAEKMFTSITSETDKIKARKPYQKIQINKYQDYPHELTTTASNNDILKFIAKENSPKHHIVSRRFARLFRR